MTPLQKALILAGVTLPISVLGFLVARHLHRPRIRTTVAVFVVGFLLFMFSCLPISDLLTFLVSQNPGPFHRPAMEAIVNQVRHSGLQPGQEDRFLLNSLDDPKSLKRWTSYEQEAPHGKWQPHVFGQITATGSLKVVIETRDLGHVGGRYGFAYSDVSLSPIPVEGRSRVLKVPGYLRFFDSKIDDRWWKVYENED